MDGMKVYYNEIDLHACQWLRNLIVAGEIPHGDVDERSIKDVQPQDLDGYDQCHFFAGIAGWALALKLAGWHGPVWTGSCPCQPFSTAGKRKGDDDARNLWPDWLRLIRERRPPAVFGEQVTSAIAHGWWDRVSTDLEALGYACGAADLCAAGIGAPHIRQRLFWLADGNSERRDGEPIRILEQQSRQASIEIARSGTVDRLADAGSSSARGISRQAGVRSEGCGIEGIWAGQADAESTGCGEVGDSILIPCRDGKVRRISAQSGDEPLAHGIPRKLGPGFARLDRVGIHAARTNRIARLKGYGNAIVPELAAKFVRACMETVLGRSVDYGNQRETV